MPAGKQLSHQRSRQQRGAVAKLGGCPWWLLQLSLGLLAGWPAPAQAGLLSPLLALMRPQLESRITIACQQWAAAGDPALEQRLAAPCRALAGPTSRCLIEETERSGRSLGVISELIAGRFGDASEWVVKRCAGRLLGLPPESFQEVPLRELAQRLRQAATPVLKP